MSSIVTDARKRQYPTFKYVFLKDVTQEFSVKKGDKLEGELTAEYVRFSKKNPQCPPNVKCMPLFVKIPNSELGKTIKKVNAAIPPKTKPPVGGTTDGSTTETQSGLFTTKNIVLGVAFLAIGYFVYTKFIKKGKGK
jgi:hypothetical protein